MMINSLSQAFSAGKMRINGRNTSNTNITGPKPVMDPPQSTGAATSKPKSSMYGNFSKEMAQRFAKISKQNNQDNQEKQKSSDSSMLVQSLTGAMGEIEQHFGREAATEAMAKVLTGTEGKVTEDSLISSIQSALADLKRRDLNGTGVKRLTDGFNKDLPLTLDPETADQKLKKGETVSLSYALSRFFGSLGTVGKQEEARGVQEAPSPLNNGEALATAPVNLANQRASADETHAMYGFNEVGQWETVEVVKRDAASTEELREAAESGINAATDLTMATIMGNGKGTDLFNSLAAYLKDELQDEESAVFVEQCVTDSQFSIFDTYGSSPKMEEMLSQVYSKVAADGDADKVRLLENYFNTEFKDALNPILAEMQQGGAFVATGMDLGNLQFKGINGISTAEENDNFSLKWGYQDNDTYDRTVTKRYLQEDIRAVKEVKEKKDEAKAQQEAALWAETAEAKLARESKESQARKKDDSNLAGEDTDETRNEAGLDRSTQLLERFTAEKRQKKLDELMTTKIGQLSDSSRESLDHYLTSNFTEEEAEKLLEHTKWNNDLMSGLAAIQHDIKELDGGNDNKSADFIVFLNNQIKPEVEKIADELGGVSFEGWQAPDELTADALEANLQANIRFAGQQEAIRAAIIEPEKMPLARGVREQALQTGIEQMPHHLQTGETAWEGQTVPQYLQRVKGAGYLINVVA